MGLKAGDDGSLSIVGQKCIDVAHSIKLELELLRHRSFVTEWSS